MFQNCIIYLCATKMDLLKDALAERAIAKDVISMYVSGKN